MRSLTTNSTTSTEVLGYTSTEKRRRAAVLQALQRNVRPPKEVVAGPVTNAGSSLMIHVPDNEYSNSLDADKSALSCSRKATLEDASNGVTRISERPYADVMVGGFPCSVKVASPQMCVFHKSMLFQRPTTDLYLARVMSGWMA